MADDLSILAYQEGKEAQQKLDAFLVGVCGALFAYIGQTYQPRRLAWDVSIFDPLALVFLALAFFAGIKRMEQFINCSRFNFHILDSGKNIGGLKEMAASGRTEGFFKSSGETFSIAQLPKQLATYEKRSSDARIQFKKSATKASRYYQGRNLLLLLGFLSVFLSRLLAPYAAINSAKLLTQPTPPTQTSQPSAISPTLPK